MRSYTVIIPSHNRPDLISRALLSVYNQTVPASEILIIDDGSEPPLEILPQLRDPRVRIIRNERAGGGAAARNIGLRVAASDCVAFLDDDDAWLPQKMERQLAYLDRRPDCVWVSCGYLRLQDGVTYPEIFSEDFVHEFGEYDSFIGSFSFAVITRAANGQFPLLDPGMPAFQDWDYYLQQRNRGSIGVIPEPLVRYHAHRSPRITNGRRNRMNGLRRCYFRHRRQIRPDARRWLLSRLIFDRAQLARTWRWKCRLTLTSILIGLPCHLPLRVKGRTLGKRLLGLVLDLSLLETLRCRIFGLFHRRQAATGSSAFPTGSHA